MYSISIYIYIHIYIYIDIYRHIQTYKVIYVYYIYIYRIFACSAGMFVLHLTCGSLYAFKCNAQEEPANPVAHEAIDGVWVQERSAARQHLHFGKPRKHGLAMI